MCVHVRTLLVASWLTITLALSGCSRPASDPGDAPLTLASSPTLPEAMVGTGYEIALQATGGVPPYQFWLADVPAQLGWLAVDPSTGRLTGTAPAAVPAGLQFSIHVTDAKGATTSAVVALRVVTCRDGDRYACYVSDGVSCSKSSVICSGGDLPDCGAGTPSNEALHCGFASGVSCGACDPATADTCAGTCRCGGSAPCGAGQACCAANCATLATSTEHCGACGNACPTAGLPANAHAVCEGGGCGWACDAGFTRCGSECKNLLTDAANCGACGTLCTGLDARCDGAGVCRASCPVGTTNCGASCVDLAGDLANCGACGRACPAPAGGSAGCTASQCTTSCPAGETNCGGTCRNLSTDAANCGTCGTVCGNAGYANAVGVCGLGFCDFRCVTGYKYCADTDTCIPSTQTCVVIVDPCVRKPWLCDPPCPGGVCP